MKILITGATGFIGQEIVHELIKQNHQIVILTRNVEAARKKLAFPFEFYAWSPTESLPPREAFQNIDAVIHLAGEGIAEKRWSEAQKQKIRTSRVLGTQNLTQAIQQYCSKPLKAFVSTSAIGYYGASGAEQPLTEKSPAAAGFLAEVCQAWEKAALSCTNTERTVIIRVGVVLGNNGGALQKLLPIFKMGLGGPIGLGKQSFSWIHKTDLAKIFVESVSNTKLKGIYNGVAPNPVDNKTFTKALGAALGRPTLFPVPPLALKTMMGEMSEIVLTSQFVSSQKLTDAGFAFAFPEIKGALNDICHLKDFGKDKKKVRCEHFTLYQWTPKALPEVFDFFSNAKNLEVITPPWLNFRVLNQSTPQIQKGTIIDYKLKIHGIPAGWTSLISEWVPNQQFVDEQTQGPYAIWHHTHQFFTYQNGTVIVDRVFYKLPLGALGKTFGGFFVKRDVKQIFAYRLKIIREKFG